MSRESIDWRVAAPLWEKALADPGVLPGRLQTPALLRFDSDAFMDQLRLTLESEPSGLAAKVARSEDWRTPAAGWLDDPAAGQAPITLYQPVQQRFYLVAASLVCRRPGQPDRRVDTRQAEKASFVVRRLVPKSGDGFDAADEATYDEYGWFGDRQGGRWLPLGDRASVDQGEERLPLFPLGFRVGGRKRRAWAGLVPVGSREVYETGARQSLRRPSVAALGNDPLADERLARFQAVVVKGLEGLAGLPQENPPADELTRESLIHTTLDLADFLEQELTEVWEASSAAGLSEEQAPVYERLVAEVVTGHTWLDLARDARAHEEAVLKGDYRPLTVTQDSGLFTREALASAANALLSPAASPATGFEYLLVAEVCDALGDARAAEIDDLLADWQDRLDAWPAQHAAARSEALSMLLELADSLERETSRVWEAVLAADPGSLSASEQALYARLDTQGLAGASARAQLADVAAHRREILLGEPTTGLTLIAAAPTASALWSDLTGLLGGDALATAIAAALPPAASAPPLPEQGPSSGDTYYRLRCVYERPRCRGKGSVLVSEPTRPFRLASFFDGDAPQRPVHIRMPVDTSLAGLRSFPKNVSVLLSNKLREQMERVQQIRINDDDEIEVVGSESSFDLGLVCSFSLPIVTIVALILLMIVVQILNIVFFWLPYFVICLPLNLRARS